MKSIFVLYFLCLQICVVKSRKDDIIYVNKNADVSKTICLYLCLKMIIFKHKCKG